MSDLAKKFGMQPGEAICLLGAPPGAEATIRAAAPSGVQILDALPAERVALILFWPQQLAGLPEQFAHLQRRILPDGAIWACMPKAKFAAGRGIDFTWQTMQAAGLQTDLVDNKVATIDEQDYGTRFVIRKDRRPYYASLAEEDRPD